MMLSCLAHTIYRKQPGSHRIEPRPGVHITLSYPPDGRESYTYGRGLRQYVVLELSCKSAVSTVSHLTRKIPIDGHGGVHVWPVETGLPLVHQHAPYCGGAHVLLRLVPAEVEGAVCTVHFRGVGVVTSCVVTK